MPQTESGMPAVSGVPRPQALAESLMAQTSPAPGEEPSALNHSTLAAAPGGRLGRGRTPSQTRARFEYSDVKSRKTSPLSSRWHLCSWSSARSHRHPCPSTGSGASAFPAVTKRGGSLVKRSAQRSEQKKNG